MHTVVSPPPPRDPLKDSFDRKYRIERQVGRGGMANVYLARDLKHDRPVALKVLKPEIASVVGGGERFLREIRTVARLHHPHILALHDSGSLDGALYYVMPYVEGESLRERLEREGRVPLATALRIAREAADALVYAHRQGVVHRDVKPENILLAGDHAIISDFGIARAIQITAGDRLTDSGFVLGTPAYMSPEQASGSSEIDGRSDVYSLGVTLFEMLTGTRPTPAAGARLIETGGRSTPSSDGHSGVPAAVRPVLAKAIALAPEARYASAAELRDALDELLPRRRARGATWQRWRGVTVAVSAAVLTLVLLAAGAAFRSRRNSRLDEAAGQRVAVTPFDVPRPIEGLPDWGTSFAEQLISALDHVSGLQPVALKATSDLWGKAGQRPTRPELGRRVSARFVVAGTLSHVGRDSLRADVIVHDVRDDKVEGFARISSEDRLPDLLSASAIGVLDVIGRWRPVAAVRGAPVAVTRSYPALLAFLAGEQAFRESDWASALAYHQQALGLDTGLAMSRRRIGMILGWRRHRDDSTALDSKLRAGALNHGQAARDSFLLLADSIDAALAKLGDADTVVWRFRRRLLTMLKKAASEYPLDAEVWYALGDARFHHGSSATEVTQRSTLDAFDEAIRLDSAFTPSYIHAVELGFSLGGRALGTRYARAYLARRPTQVHRRGLELASRLAEAGGPQSAEGRRLLDSADFDTKYVASDALAEWPDSAETALVVMKELDAEIPRRDVDPASAGGRPVPPRTRTVHETAFRGHLREAAAGLGGILAALPESDDAYPLMVELALLGAAKPDSTSAAFVQLARSGRIRRATFALPLWAARRDTAAIDALAFEARRATGSQRRYETDYAVAAADAYRMLVLGDTVKALTLFEELPDSLCQECVRDRFQRGQLLLARHRYNEAARVLGEPYNNLAGVLLVLDALEQARLAERTGDRDEARRLYQYVADAWAHADADQAALADSAHAGLRRVGGTR